MAENRALLLFHTLRHLRPVQVWGRVMQRLPQPLPKLAAPPPRRGLARPWVEPHRPEPSLLSPNRIRLLNVEGRIETANDWKAHGQSRLWAYNLHYFADLTAKGASERAAWHRDLIARWIAENPPTMGTGWEPFPLSLRVANWIKWSLGGGKLDDAALSSLATQLRWLERRIEWHILGNHLLANAKALIMGGLFFEGAEADGWLKSGSAILAAELDEQILGDGGHFERSPMYHALVLEDLLDLHNAFTAFGQATNPLAQNVARRIAPMLDWLSVMQHPDGGFAFFNDTAFGIAATCEELDAYARRLGISPAYGDAANRYLSSSGYVRMTAGPVAVIADVAPVGPDYLPGHAHADTLSFEMSVGQERVIVNGGTSVYGEGPDRQAQRATAAHSTVEIDGHNSSEVWAGFRVARRAYPFDIRYDAGPERIELSAAHDGYRRLKGAPVHRRRWNLTNERLEIEDAVEGPHGTAIARFHLGEGVRVTAEQGGLAGTLRLPSGRDLRWTSTSPVTVSASRWHPEFGRSVETQCFAVPLVSGRSVMRFTW